MATRESSICVNGDFFPASYPVFAAANTSYKWGEGLFETMRVVNGDICLHDYHFQRLKDGMQLIGLDAAGFMQDKICRQIQTLCVANDCVALARVRLSVFGYKNETGYCIEASPLEAQSVRWNEKGWQTGMYPHARKSMDAFSNIKSANYLQYRMAAKFAEQKGWNDCILLNAAGRLCDSSKANIFIVKKDEILTPALNEGCIAGVMRRHLIAHFKNKGIDIVETKLTEDDLLNADEAFLTNAIVGVKWIRRFAQREYNCQKAFFVFSSLFPNL